MNRLVLAILMSFLAVLAYLAYRFEWRFGIAAVVATMHLGNPEPYGSLLAARGMHAGGPTCVCARRLASLGAGETQCR